jgi:hypothetical protein
MSGRVTGGNTPKYPYIDDVYPNYEQMSDRTKSLLSASHRKGREEFESRFAVNTPESREIDKDVKAMRRDTNFPIIRDPFNAKRETKRPFNLEKYKRDVPQILSSAFRQSRKQTEVMQRQKGWDQRRQEEMQSYNHWKAL